MVLTVSVNDLYEKIKEMYDDKMDFTSITLDEGDESLPPCISFTAWTKDDSSVGIDYEEVEGTASEY